MPFAKEAESPRICWKCEGSVSPHVPQCPYCSAFLQDPPVASGGFSSCHVTFPKESIKDEPEDLFAVSSEDWEAMLEKQHTFSQPEEQPEAEWSWLQHWHLAACFLGIGLVLFALVILLFATDAGFSLTWPKNRAYFYSLAGLALFYQGNKKL